MLSIDCRKFLQFFHSFLPRDAMRERGLYCRRVSVRPSVYPSVCHVRVLYIHLYSPFAIIW